jgi:hypothetical protein
MHYVVLGLLLASSGSPAPTIEGPEIVMNPGSAIAARTARGPITIRAGEMTPGSGEITTETPWGPITVPAPDKYRRTYLWGHCEGSADLTPRTKRWYGSLGISFPGPGFHWPECEGVARAVVEEGQQHFDTAAEAINWLKTRNRDEMPFVYRNDGLVIGWDTVIPNRKQINVEVWQIIVAGKKPTTLAGACETCITATGLR